MSSFEPGDVVYFKKKVPPSIPVDSLGVVIGSFGNKTYTVYVASYNEPNRDIDRFFAAVEGMVEAKSFNLFVKNKIIDGADKLVRLQNVMKMDSVTDVLVDTMMIKNEGILFGLKEAKSKDIRLPLGLTLIDREGDSVEVARNEEGVIWLFSKKDNKLYKNNLKSITDNFWANSEIELIERLSHMLIKDNAHLNESMLPIGGRALKTKKIGLKSSLPKNPVMSSGRKLGNLVRHTKKKKERE